MGGVGNIITFIPPLFNEVHAVLSCMKMH